MSSRAVFKGRYRYLALLAVVLLGLALTLSLLVYAGIRQGLRDAERDTRNLAAVLDARLGATFRDADRTLDYLAGAPHADLDLAMRLDPDLAGLAVIGADGQPAPGGGGRMPPAALAQALARLRANPARGVEYSDVATVEGRRLLVAVEALHDSSGKPAGAVVAAIDLALTAAVMEGVDVGAGGAIALRRIDDQQFVLRHPELPRATIKPSPAERGLIDSPGGQGTVSDAVGPDGVSRLLSVWVLSATPFYLVVAKSRDEVLAVWMPRVDALVIAWLGMMAALLVMFLRLRRSETEGAAASERLRLLGSVFEHTSDALVISDSERRIVAINQAFTDTTGYTIEELRGRHPIELSADTSRRQEITAALSHLVPGDSWHGEITVRRKDGSTFASWLQLSRVQDAAGQVLYTVAAHRDISQRKHAVAELAMLAGVFEHSVSGIMIADAGLKVMRVNQAYVNMGGFDDEAEFVGQDARFELDPSMPRETVAAMGQSLRATGRWEGEEVGRRKNGTPYPRWTSIVRVHDDEGRFLHAISSSIDITALKRVETELRASEQRLRLMGNLFEHSREAFLVTDHTRRAVAVNPAFTRITGYEEADVLGKVPNFLGADTSADINEERLRAIETVGYWEGESIGRRKDGSLFPRWLVMSAIRDDQRRITHRVAAVSDITQVKQAEGEIQRLAHHDNLTGLPNRLNLEARFDQAATTAHRLGQKVALLVLDLDRFKTINDTLGHSIGDLLLIEVGRRLVASVRESDIVARLGGDEFVVVLAGVDGPANAAPIIDKMAQSLASAFKIAGHPLHTSPSIGISIYPDDGETMDELLKNADSAMYHAKEEGRNTFRFFAPSMNAAAGERLSLENNMRAGLADREFFLHYQPQIDLATGETAGFEALMRWQHREHGLVSPGKFIPIAEETGMIGDLGAFALREGLEQMRAWRRAGHRNGRVAINLSAHQLRDHQLPAKVRGLLAELGLEPGDLELEITESAAMKNPQATIAILNELRAAGIELAVDDFGTGYSSLSYLKLLPIQRLKLDQSFVRDIESDPNDAAICRATIALAHSLGLEVIAEGVETEAQLAFMKQLHCDIVQGYYFSRPVPHDQAVAFLGKRPEAAMADAYTI